MNKKLIFEYCGWKIDYEEQPHAKYGTISPNALHPLDGNDILEAVRIIESKGDEYRFYDFAQDVWLSNMIGKSLFLYLLQNFFELMSQWLEVRK